MWHQSSTIVDQQWSSNVVNVAGVPREVEVSHEVVGISEEMVPNKGREAYVEDV